MAKVHSPLFFTLGPIVECSWHVLLDTSLHLIREEQNAQETYTQKPLKVLLREVIRDTSLACIKQTREP